MSYRVIFPLIVILIAAVLVVRGSSLFGGSSEPSDGLDGATRRIQIEDYLHTLGGITDALVRDTNGYSSDLERHIDLLYDVVAGRTTSTAIEAGYVTALPAYETYVEQLRAVTAPVSRQSEHRAYLKFADRQLKYVREAVERLQSNRSAEQIRDQLVEERMNWRVGHFKRLFDEFVACYKLQGEALYRGLAVDLRCEPESLEYLRGLNSETIAEIPSSFLNSVDEAEAAGIALYWLGPRLRIGSLEFSSAGAWIKQEPAPAFASRYTTRANGRAVSFSLMAYHKASGAADLATRHILSLPYAEQTEMTVGPWPAQLVWADQGGENGYTYFLIIDLGEAMVTAEAGSWSDDPDIATSQNLAFDAELLVNTVAEYLRPVNVDCPPAPVSSIEAVEYCSRDDTQARR